MYCVIITYPDGTVERLAGYTHEAAMLVADVYLGSNVGVTVERTAA